MDPIASVVDKVKSFAQSSQDLVSRHFGFHEDFPRQNPIDILKRLQREAFSDIMKLRDRQEKVERILSSYKHSKGGPFQETSTTHVKGEVHALGAMLLMGNTDDEEETLSGLHRQGVRPGLLSRFVFETSLREESDKLVAELVAGGDRSSDGVSGKQLSLAKVFYKTEINDWFSAVAIPVGAHFRDIDAPLVSSYQGMTLTEVSELGPPLLNQRNGSAIGLTVRKPNVAASLAQSITNHEAEQGLNASSRCLRTFGQVTCNVLSGVKLSLLGCHQILSPSNSLHHPAGAIVLPVSFLRPRSDMDPESSAPPLEMSRSVNHVSSSSSSIAFKLDSSLMDENTRIGGWIEIQKSRGKEVKWSVSITDKPEDEVGWGMSVGGVVDGSRNHDRFQVESYLRFNIGNGFRLSPGLVYLANSNGRTIGLMLQSHWSL